MTAADLARHPSGLARFAMVLALSATWPPVACLAGDAVRTLPASGLSGATEPSASSGASASDFDLQSAYAQAVQRAVMAHWLRPESAQHDLHCVIEIRQDLAGNVDELKIADRCNADEATRRSIVAAVRRAQPLPHEGFETVLTQNVRFVFRSDSSPRNPGLH